MLFEQVAEFHRAFGLPVATSPSLPGIEQRALRRALLAEEVTELRDALAAHDRVEVADALADIAYIICGTMLVYGVAPLPGYSIPVVGNFVEDHDTPQSKAMADKVIQDLYDHYVKYVEAENDDDLAGIDDWLTAMLWTAAGAACVQGYALAEVFAEVHASNMSKLGADGKPVYRDDGKVLKGPSFRRPDIARVLASFDNAISMPNA